MMDPRGHRGPSVLVVDDESDIRLMTRDLLEFDGYQVSEAANGAEALELLANEAIHVLITDLYMPGLDGYDLIRQVLHSGRRAPRIIAVSGVATDLARPTDAEAASLLQVDAILDKPFTRQQLVRALASTDERESPGTPGTTPPVEHTPSAPAIPPSGSPGSRTSRVSDVPFSPDEARKIRESVRAKHGPILCPRCGTPLSAGRPGGSNTPGHSWIYRCPPCRRSLELTEL